MKDTNWKKDTPGGKNKELSRSRSSRRIKIIRKIDREKDMRTGECYHCQQVCKAAPTRLQSTLYFLYLWYSHGFSLCCTLLNSTLYMCLYYLNLKVQGRTFI